MSWPRNHPRPEKWTRANSRTRNARLAFAGVAVLLASGFATVTLRLCLHGFASSEAVSHLAAAVPIRHAKSRPDIVDRNGRLLATDIPAFWLYADPQHVVNANETAEKLVRLFPDLSHAALLDKLRAKNRFEWVKRGLTPREAERVYKLGLPGLHLLQEPRRVYPAGPLAAHVLGVTNVDNIGLNGIERYIDQFPQGQFTTVALGERPIVKLSIDFRVQHALAEELRGAQQRSRAKAAFAVVMDVRNGEVLASVSLPDFDPNEREQAIGAGKQNRVLTDTYELGSVFKAFTVALALEDGLVQRTDVIDTRAPVAAGRRLLRDAGGGRRMSVDEIFIRSSNIGTARLAQLAGIPRQRQFLTALGLLEPVRTEAGRSAAPSEPETWRPVNAITIAYGHGVAVPPLAFAAAASALVNGGTLIQPTFLLSASRHGSGQRIISTATSAALRDMMRLAVERGTGKRAAVAGIGVGGKTGTAQKVKRGRYSKDVLTSFFAAFPIQNPRYLLLVSLDEPQPTAETPRTEASHNAAPAAGAIIRRIAPILGVTPFTQIDEMNTTSYEAAASGVTAY